MLDSILGSSTVESTFTVASLLKCIGTAIVLGLIISFVYMKTHNTKTPSRAFSITLVVLPSVITIIIMLIGNSVARAFSLAGAFQIIRFRSAPGNAKDITYVLFSMAVGLCCGMGFIAYGIIAAIILCVLMVVLEAVKFGKNKAIQQNLRILIPENLDYQGAFDGILKKYTDSYTRKKVKTTDLGSLFELQYVVTTKPNINEKEFIDELRIRNGNLSISLALAGDDEDF